MRWVLWGCGGEVGRAVLGGDESGRSKVCYAMVDAAHAVGMVNLAL